MTFASHLVVLCGGLLIGTSAALLWTRLHRIAGISGILGELLDGAADYPLRLTFLASMVVTGLLVALVMPGAIGPTAAPLGRIVLGGLLVGFGTRLGNGCTSGHGVCGVGRASTRSYIATVTFLGVGMLTVGIYRVVFGVAP